jgi:hypothetical protein
MANGSHCKSPKPWQTAPMANRVNHGKNVLDLLLREAVLVFDAAGEGFILGE